VRSGNYHLEEQNPLTYMPNKYIFNMNEMYLNNRIYRGLN